MTCHVARSIEGCRVLIIEDEYLLADDLAKALRLVGCKVIGPVAELRMQCQSRRIPLTLP
jgi:hypothetical protein